MASALATHTGSGDRFDGGRVLVWDPADPGVGAVELGRHDGGVRAMAVLPDGRLVTGGYDDGRVLVWDVESDSPGIYSHIPRAYSLLPSLHLELASSSVT